MVGHDGGPSNPALLVDAGAVDGERRRRLDCAGALGGLFSDIEWETNGYARAGLTDAVVSFIGEANARLADAAGRRNNVSQQHIFAYLDRLQVQSEVAGRSLTA